MARWLAYEWNDRELRVAVATPRSDRLVLEHLFDVNLRDALGGAAAGGEEPFRPSPEDIGRCLAAALAARNIRRPTTFVTISRSFVELRQLSVPPVSDDDLPEVVKLQALREFTHVTEDWTIDYLSLDGDPTQPRNVLVAALSPQLLAQIEETCRVAQLRPERLLLRPCASASLARRCLPLSEGEIRLIIDLVGDEVDLSVIVEGRLVFMRTARLVGDPLREQSSAETLVGEIRRTMMAAQNQLGGGRANHLVLCGNTPAHEHLVGLLRERLDLSVSCFNPFQPFTLSPQLAESLPDHPGQDTALLGLLADEKEKITPSLDFLHPHRRPEPPSKKRQLLLAGIGAAILAALGIGYGWWQLAQLDQEIVQLRQRQSELDRELKAGAQVAQLAQAVRGWIGTQIDWLEELRRLNEKIPPAKEVMLTKVSLAAGSKAGEISLEGFAASSESVQKMEQSLEDETHRVVSKGKAEDDSQKPYTLRFGTSVVIRSAPSAPARSIRPPSGRAPGLTPTAAPRSVAPRQAVR
jgi:Tfp pilus assembly PilM family ATPase/Tfp pilus assembly protein PilN